MADIIVVLIVLIAAYIGSKRGLMRSLVGIASTFASLIVGVVLYHPVSEYLSKSEFGKKITEAVAKYFETNPDAKVEKGWKGRIKGTKTKQSDY